MSNFDNIGEIPLDELADRCRNAGLDILMNPSHTRDQEKMAYLFLCVERAMREIIASDVAVGTIRLEKATK